MATVSQGNHETGEDRNLGKSLPVPRFEMQKTIPTESMEKILRKLQAKKPTQLMLEDFASQDSNDGKSILITLFVNSIAALRPELGEAQWARIAAHAAIHHPSYLHEAFLDGDIALELTKSFLTNRPMKLDIQSLCPMDTPYLIVDTELREHLGQLMMTPVSELRRIITPFLQCFYPSDWELLEQAVRAASREQLQEFISIPGVMHTFFVEADQRFTFNPPQWLSLSAFQAKQGGKQPHTGTAAQDKDDDDDDDDSVDSADLLHPLREMRIDQAEFDRLEPDLQKKQILAVFPTRMATVLPADVFGYMIVMLSEMSATSIHGAMDPMTFHRLIGYAKKTAVKAAELTPAPQIYYYRFRVQHLGKGYRSWANDSTGGILQSWIKAWIPMFAASRYTLALTKRPSDRHIDAIDISTLQDTPTLPVLESYIYEVIRTKQGIIHQFDFWICTDCPDINNNGANSFIRSSEKTAQYQDSIRKAAIWSMKMERLPQGYIPCIFLGNSLLKDDERMIKEEVLIRTGFSSDNEMKFQVEWITIATKSEHAHTMAHCILTKPENHQLVSTLCSLLNPTCDVEFPVTSAYQPMIIPPRRGPEVDQELSQAIARHQEYTRALVQVSLKHLPPTSMCNFIPLELGMDVKSPDHDATIAYLMLHGTITNVDGSKLASPVTRVNMDSKRTRMYLHAPRNSAGQLVLFARGIYRLLAQWYQTDISQATLDARDAEKTALSQERTTGHSPQHGQNSIHDNSADNTPPSTVTQQGDTQHQSPPSSPQQMISVPRDQWNQAVHLLITSAAKMDKLIAFMDQMPTVITHKDALDEAVSVITQSMTLNSDLVNNRADITVMETRRTLAERINDINGQVSRIGSSIGSKQEQMVASMAQVLQLMGEMVSKMEGTAGGHMASAMDDDVGGRGIETTDCTDPLDTAAQLVDPNMQLDGAAEEAPAARQTPSPTARQDTETTAQTEAQPETITGVPPSDEDRMNVDRESKVGRTDTTTVVPGSNAEADGGQEEHEEDWEKKYESQSDLADDNIDSPLPHVPLTRCHACNKLDADIEVCDHCEIPHHFDCLIKEPNDGPSRYCNECIEQLYGEEQKMPSQSSGNSSDLELSESSTSVDSEVSEFRPTSKTVSKTPTGDNRPSQPTATKYALRERKRDK